MKKVGFTLIELLAVIIILAVIALIATPIVLKVVDNAKESSRKSSISGYADAVRLALVEKQFETGNNPVINEDFLSGLKYQGDRVSCDEVVNTRNIGVLLKKCKLGSDTNEYCFANGKIYNCGSDFNTIYDNADKVETPQIVYKDSSGANQPELDEGMIPIYFDGNTAKKADIKEKWYDYDLKEWANVVLVTEATRNTYKNATKGTIINEADVLAYLVWVPRYKYKLFNVEAFSVSPREIEIVFESKDTTKSTGSTNGTYLTHSAFTFGTSEINGIWVGKFETTGNAATPTIKPNDFSLTNQNISTQFATAQKFNSATYGLGGDAHMMKNIEWGATIYLSHSKYGTNKQIRINNNNDYKTGCGGTTENASSTSTCTNAYGSVSDYPQSTTGNITGIFDMSGGAWEYVMGNMADGSGNFYSSNAGFGSTPDLKYYDKYANGSTYDNQTAFNRKLLGDATGETRGWYSDYTSFVYSSSSWFPRGGFYGDAATAGGFNFSCNPGAAYNSISFRIVQVK